jgi:hypothetical protein
MILTADQFLNLIDEVQARASVVEWGTQQGRVAAVRRRMEELHVTGVERAPDTRQIIEQMVPLDWQRIYAEWVYESTHDMMRPDPGTGSREPPPDFLLELVNGVDTLRSNPFAALHYLLNVSITGVDPRTAMASARNIAGLTEPVLAYGAMRMSAAQSMGPAPQIGGAHVVGGEDAPPPLPRTAGSTRPGTPSLVGPAGFEVLPPSRNQMTVAPQVRSRLEARYRQEQSRRPTVQQQRFIRRYR